MSDEEYDSEHLEYNSDDSLECPEDMDMSILPIGIYMHYTQRRKEEDHHNPERLLDHAKELVLLMFSSFSLDEHEKPFMIDEEVPIDDFVERALSQLKEDVVLGRVEVVDEFGGYVEIAEGLVANYRSGMMEDRHNKLSELFKKHGMHGMFKALSEAVPQEEEPDIENKCMVCVERDMVPFPATCQHMAVCAVCAEKLKTCPTCRAHKTTEDDSS
jgi:hypothetical protein